jgi:hypothetical protein
LLGGAFLVILVAAFRNQTIVLIVSYTLLP